MKNNYLQQELVLNILITKKMKEDNCQKCGEYGWVHLHHVLPKVEFGGE